MMSHELARKLLELPDLPVATAAMNHEYFSKGDAHAHGSFKIGLAHHYSGDHLIMGDMCRRILNYPNWWIREMYLGEIPNQWSVERGGKWVFSKPYGGPTVADGEWAESVLFHKQHHGWDGPPVKELDL